ncbi:MAG TPA: cytochrome c oxidase assembly protein [Kineosporiaceae bacterium]|nr:cytochrome c oxidase assembly protein [Kineosporiaceae bacterium]
MTGQRDAVAVSGVGRTVVTGVGVGVGGGPTAGAAIAAVLVATGVTAAAVVTALAMGESGYALPGAGFPAVTACPGALAACGEAVARAVVVLASTVCLGGLVTVVLLRAQRLQGRLRVRSGGVSLVVPVAAALWAAGAGALLWLDATVGGAPEPAAGGPGAGTAPIEPGPAGAWPVVLICAGLILVTTLSGRSWPGWTLLLPVAAVGVVAPLMVGQVLIGPDHDFAGDATAVGAPVAAAWFGVTGVLLLSPPGAGEGEEELRRYLRLARGCWPVVLGSLLVVAAVETAGTGPVASTTGRLCAVQVGLLLAFGLLLVRGLRSGTGAGEPGRGGDPARTRLPAVSALLAGGYLAVDLARLWVPPPSYGAPTSVAQTFLGYDLREAPGLSELALHWRPNLLFCTLAAGSVTGYLVGVRLLARRGDRWPVGRTIAWLLGWALVVTTTSSGVGRFSGAMFSAHMALHMTLNMVAPLFLVLGGPVTLVLRAVRARPRDQTPGLREWTVALRRSAFVRLVCHPVHALVAFAATSYLLYSSGVFEQASRYHWGHIAMNLAYLGIGYLFFSLVIGVDQPPRPLPYMARFGLLMVAMPFHAFFGVVVMTTRGVIARGFYETLGTQLSWITDLHQDQYLGGGIAWVAGEVPITITVIALLLQWSRHEDREAVRLDRQLDSAADDRYEAYNAMLARLAAADAAGETGPRR